MQLFVKRGFHALLNSPEAKGFFFLRVYLQNNTRRRERKIKNTNAEDSPAVPID